VGDQQPASLLVAPDVGDRKDPVERLLVPDRKSNPSQQLGVAIEDQRDGPCLARKVRVDDPLAAAVQLQRFAAFQDDVVSEQQIGPEAQECGAGMNQRGDAPVVAQRARAAPGRDVGVLAQDPHVERPRAEVQPPAEVVRPTGVAGGREGLAGEGALRLEAHGSRGLQSFEPAEGLDGAFDVLAGMGGAGGDQQQARNDELHDRASLAGFL